VVGSSVILLEFNTKDGFCISVVPRVFLFVFSLDLSGGLHFRLSYVLDLIPCRFFVACARGFFMC
jgi:hypothetical protein